MKPNSIKNILPKLKKKKNIKYLCRFYNKTSLKIIGFDVKLVRIF